MNKEKSVSICPKCQKVDKVIKHGQRNNIQRYKCKRCNHVFSEKRKRVKYTANEKVLLALLVSLINSERGNLAKTAIKNVSDVLQNIENYKLIEKQSRKNDLIFCYNPRILVCDNGNGNIVIFRIPDREKSSNQIKIIDDEYSRM
ncbi:unknown [Acinetobacter sp. CAG:196]|jgi:transposase-like protein|nr:unknown [Acinetobacter sp. CAG:196]DAB13818.1 MAG TPA: hypothetical protein CPU00_10890 [Candidatus Gastranaerophilales bacterium HUM_18]